MEPAEHGEDMDDRITREVACQTEEGVLNGVEVHTEDATCVHHTIDLPIGSPTTLQHNTSGLPIGSPTILQYDTSGLPIGSPSMLNMTHVDCQLAVLPYLNIM